MPRNLQKQRIELRLSQSALARLAGVPRIHICLHELGDRPLSPTELDQVQAALIKEAERLKRVSQSIEDGREDKHDKPNRSRLLDPERTGAYSNKSLQENL